jgi:hypothetical protein
MHRGRDDELLRPLKLTSAVSVKSPPAPARSISAATTTRDAARLARSSASMAVEEAALRRRVRSDMSHLPQRQVALQSRPRTALAFRDDACSQVGHRRRTVLFIVAMNDAKAITWSPPSHDITGTEADL